MTVRFRSAQCSIMTMRSFSFRLLDNGREVPLALGPGGVRLGEEHDASARPVRLSFWPADDLTATMVRFTVPGGDVRLESFEDAGRLGFRGNLPAGRFLARLAIVGLKLKSPRQRIDFSSDEHVVVPLQIVSDPRRVTLRDIGDSSLQRVLTAPASRLDNQPIVEWLADVRVRPPRKACLLNVLAKLRAVATPDHTLLDDVQNVFFADHDRIYARTSANIGPQLRAMAGQRFLSAGRPRADVHARLLDAVEARGWGRAQDFDLVSFREVGRPALQVVLAEPRAGGGDVFADLDIDLGNPLADLHGIIIHTKELIDPDATDHLALRQDLGTTPAAPFLFYDVV
jgi:hypothetical protein